MTRPFGPRIHQKGCTRMGFRKCKCLQPYEIDLMTAEAFSERLDASPRFMPPRRVDAREACVVLNARLMNTMIDHKRVVRVKNGL